ncbi:MAG: replicative DNA helicase [Synergistaceae bacterium]|jgi:replicative DNA helicase|nr:replicative DNA helicase [Synergistaceae bacterium]
MMYDRVAPQNTGAERAILGACLLEQEALGNAVENLTPEDFYDLNHRAAFEVMVEMFAANRPVEMVTFSEELMRRGLFEKLGGQPFFASVVAEVPTTANVEFHASIVREKSVRRRLIEAGNHIVRLGYATDIENAMALDEAERAVFEITQNNNKVDFKPVRDILGGTFAKIEEQYRRSGAKVSGFDSGFADLDALTGGFQPGSLNIIAARPSMGKTALALNIAQFGGAKTGDAVLIFSLEMSSDQLVQRMLGSEAQVNVHAMRTGVMGKSEWDDLMNAAGRLAKAPIYIDDSSMLTTMDFRSRCRRFKARYSNLGLVVVDYLQLMSFGGRNTDNKQQEVAEISRMLKGVARELQCPVVALSQLSRAVEQRTEKKPMLSDLRDSGAIEQDADTVMLLYRPDYYDGAVNPDMDSEAFLSLSKNRNGPTNEIRLIFKREITRFFNATTM